MMRGSEARIIIPFERIEFTLLSGAQITANFRLSLVKA